jgi:methyl-accepting chemotaxis protein
VALHLPIAVLAALSLASGDRVVDLYDGPLMGISHARLARSSPDEARSVVQLGLSEAIAKEPSTTFGKLNPSADDVRSVRERVAIEDVTVALEHAESRGRDWSKTVVLTLSPSDHGPMMLPMSFSVEEKSRIAATVLDDLVEVVTAYGFGYPMEAEDSVATTRAKMLGLGICMALVALILAKFLDIP